MYARCLRAYAPVKIPVAHHLMMSSVSGSDFSVWSIAEVNEPPAVPFSYVITMESTCCSFWSARTHTMRFLTS